MALRSGYKGFKKLLGLKTIRPGTLAVDDAALANTFFPRSEQAVLGAKNWFNYTKETTSNNGVTFTNSNNQSCTLSGQATADQAAIEMGSLTVDKDTEFIFNGASSSNNAKIHMYVFDSTTNARPYTDASKTTQQTNNCFGTGANSEIPFFAEAGHVIKVYARVQTTGTSVPNNTVFWPMVRLATDPDPTYVPHAMTNKELTETSPKMTIETLKLEVSKSVVHSVLIWGCGGATTPVLALICISNATQGTAQAFKLTNVDYYDVTATREGNIVTINVLHNGTEQLWSGISWIATSRGTIREVK